MGILRNAALAACSPASIAASMLFIPAAQAQDQARQHFSLPQQPLAKSLRDVSVASRRDIAAPAELVRGRIAPALEGDFTAEEAVEALIAGSGLRQGAIGAGIVLDAGRADASAENAGDLVVTGSRIRGAPIASPVVTLGEREIRDAARANLGDVVRAIPQNFGGGQNPGIGITTPAASGIDVSGGSGLNLRGLGSDATLTLLNGHRLSYSASRQSIDISSIPVIAVERIEIVPDGASALYGSDAVAGVANVILKSRANGLETRASLGSATDGGYFVQNYAALGGAQWRGGGAVLAYEFADNGAIEADQRSYAATRAPGLTLFPRQRRHSASLVAHQDVLDNVSLGMDALYNWRRSVSRIALNPAGDLSASKEVRSSVSQSFAVAPRLDFALGRWAARLAGSYGRDRVDFRADDFTGARLDFSSVGYYRNTGKMVELGADGPFLDLPGGSAKLALGAGYRNNDFILFAGTGSISNIAHNQDSYHAYGELSVPIVGPAQGLGLVKSLTLNVALRHERYPGIGRVTTPKLGLVYAPGDDLELKASWGKSFKAPTMFQLYQVQSVSLVTITSVGGSGYPAGTTALVTGGGNASLRPERATSWSATVALHPSVLAGARLEVGYFNTRYADRVVTPITFTSQALRNAIYADYVTLSPTRAAIDAEVANASGFFNSSGSAYDPARVGAILNRRNVNAGRQSVQGVDVLASYSLAMPDDAQLRLALNAAYLESSQQITAAQPATVLAGTLYNPAHFRARASASWSQAGFGLSAYLTRIGGVSDRRSTTVLRVPGMTTLDLSLRYAVEAPGLLHGLEVGAAVQNLFNAKPAQIATSIFYEAPYDTTNYSPVGRFLNLSVSKKW
jgi:iron complex outermembrane receptor protein